MRPRTLYALILAGATAGATSAHAELIYGLTNRNQLLTFDSATPQGLFSARFITGLEQNEEMLTIDVRPADGKLYGVGSYSRIYDINPTNGAATLIGSGFAPPVLNGIQFGSDFNPVVDRLRLVSDLGQNLRLNQLTGSLLSADGNLAFAAADPNFGSPASVKGVAYTNNVAGAGSTTLFGLHIGASNLLVTINPPNSGTLNTIVALSGPKLNTSDEYGFDISGATGTAYVSVGGSSPNTSGLYTVNLATGVMSSLGSIGSLSGPLVIRDISVVNIPGPGGLASIGVASLVLARRRRR